jgi:hypothetical protein
MNAVAVSLADQLGTVTRALPVRTLNPALGLFVEPDLDTKPDMRKVRASSFYDFVENVACGFDDHCVMLQRDPVSRGS